jgi:hypothetical protein
MLYNLRLQGSPARGFGGLQVVSSGSVEATDVGFVGNRFESGGAVLLNGATLQCT